MVAVVAPRWFYKIADGGLVKLSRRACMLWRWLTVGRWGTDTRVLVFGVGMCFDERWFSVVGGWKWGTNHTRGSTQDSAAPPHSR